MTTRYGFGKHLVHCTALAMAMGVTLGVGYGVQAAGVATARKTPAVTKTVINNLPEKAIFRLLCSQNKIYAFKYGPDHDIATLEDYSAGGSVYAYDPAANRWEARANMPVKKVTYSIAVVNTKILVIGGFTAPDTPSSSVEEYDPAKDTWAIKKGMPTPRCRIGVVILNDKIFALGGRTKDNETDALEVYDPLNDVWSVKNTLPRKLMGVAAAAIKNKIYLVSGVNVVNGYFESVYDFEEYDPATDSWKEMPPWSLEKGPNELSVVNGRLFVVGGASSVHSLTEYDYAAKQWVLRSNMPAASRRTLHFSKAVLDGKIYTFGGGNWVDNGWKASNHAQRYDPSTDTWEELEPLSESKIGMGVVAVGNKIYVMGGEKMGLPGLSGQDKYSDKIEIYEARGEAK